MTHRIVPACILALTTYLVCGSAQTAQQFETASIRQNLTEGDNWSIRTPDGGWFRATGVNPGVLILEAFGLRKLQVAGVPAWCNSEKYDIVARTAIQGQLSPEEIRPLLRSLLADRFHLTYHAETRQLPEYALVVGKKGAKLTANPAQDGPLGIEARKSPGKVVMKATRKPIGELAHMLANQLDAFVVDETGLNGNFDFTLEWSPNTEQESVLPSIFTALEEQLGLRLVARKGPVEVTVIDRIERPSEN